MQQQVAKSWSAHLTAGSGLPNRKSTSVALTGKHFALFCLTLPTKPVQLLTCRNGDSFACPCFLPPVLVDKHGLLFNCSVLDLLV